MLYSPVFNQPRQLVTAERGIQESHNTAIICTLRHKRGGDGLWLPHGSPWCCFCCRSQASVATHGVQAAFLWRLVQPLELWFT